jgi:hypothetical protein
VPPIPHPFLFSQIGLDSGALTLLGCIVHRLTDPGEYRGVAIRPNVPASVFYLTVEGGRAINQVNIDLAALADPSASSQSCCTGGEMQDGSGQCRFLLGAGGYVAFHVSGGPGGFAVRLGKSAEEPQPKDFDSTALTDGDLFAATILRPGRYRITNLAQEHAQAGEIDVAYPLFDKTAYQPPPPIRVNCTQTGFDPARVALTATQGSIFVCRASSRLKIELVTALDPPK